MIDKTDELLKLAKESDVMDIAENEIASINKSYDENWALRSVYGTFSHVVASGRRIYIPEDDELLLDIDSPESMTKASRIIELDMHLAGMQYTINLFKSKTEGHAHISVKHSSFRDLTLIAKIYKQALFGSDPLKEYLSLARARLGVRYPIRLFNFPGLS